MIFFKEKEEFNPLYWEPYHDNFMKWLDLVSQLKDKKKTLFLGTKRKGFSFLIGNNIFIHFIQSFP